MRRGIINEEMACNSYGCATHTINAKLNQVFPIRNQPVGKIIYFGDPMCSWCWGIANHLEKTKDHFKYQLNFEMVMGGLRAGGGDNWNNEMKEMLRRHWNHVNQYSGQPFNYELLNRDNFNYDTEPPSRAVRIIRDIAPEKEFRFFKEVQHAFYVNNFNLGNINSYRAICEKMEIPFIALKGLFDEEKYIELVKKDFQMAVEYGIKGFPSVIVQINDDVQLIANGYTTFENMKVLIDRILEAVNSE